MHTRQLVQSDIPQLVDFLERRIETSMIPLSNLRQAGLGSTQRFAAEYFATFDGDQMSAVAAHCWNDNVLVQGELGVAEAAHAVVRHTQRPVAGILGPLASVRVALSALGLERRRTTLSSEERLYSLQLLELRVPPQLATGEVTCRRATEADRRTFLVDWRVGYNVATLGVERTPTTMREARESVTRPGASDAWVLVSEGRPVSTTGFNAEASGIVQVGGVWTPPELRGRGFARCVVAASLLDRQRSGATRSILFTDRNNVAAQRAYEALGFRHIGEYGIWLFG